MRKTLISSGLFKKGFNGGKEYVDVIVRVHDERK